MPFICTKFSGPTVYIHKYTTKDTNNAMFVPKPTQAYEGWLCCKMYWGEHLEKMLYCCTTCVKIHFISCQGYHVIQEARLSCYKRARAITLHKRHGYTRARAIMLHKSQGYNVIEEPALSCCIRVRAVMLHKNQGYHVVLEPGPSYYIRARAITLHNRRRDYYVIPRARAIMLHKSQGYHVAYEPELS